VPFASHERAAAASALHATQQEASPRGIPGPLFDEVTEDRHVLVTALAGRADVLVTANIADFRTPNWIDLSRDDVFGIHAQGAPLVVCKPGFVARFLRQGIVPSWACLSANAASLGLVVNDR
jgi:hypothetical protein